MTTPCTELPEPELPPELPPCRYNQTRNINDFGTYTAHDMHAHCERYLKWALQHMAMQPAPTMAAPWIQQYPGELFVVYDPTTDGSDILGAARTLQEAQRILHAVRAQ